MNDANILDTPTQYAYLQAKCEEIGFTMPSDHYIGPFLKTLMASKPGGSFLELATGISVAPSWMIDGLDADSSIVSVDNDQQLIDIAKECFSEDKRVELVCADGEQWIQENSDLAFDLIFADAWPGKYGQLDEILSMVKVGGMYVIDDMDEQPNWPEGHSDKASQLLAYLESRQDYSLVKMNWSTGVVVCTRRF